MAKEEKEELPFNPEDYDQFDNDLDEHPVHDFDTEAVAMGTVVKLKTTTGTRDDPDEKVRYVVLDNKEVLSKVWESAHLKDFFDSIVPGQIIVIHFIGMKPLKGKKTMRLFNVYTH